MKYDQNNELAVAIAFEFGKLRHDIDKIIEERNAEIDTIYEDCGKKRKAIFEEAIETIAKTESHLSALIKQ